MPICPMRWWLKIPGAQRGNSVEANRALYLMFVYALHEEAGEQAIMLWHLDADSSGNDDDEDER